MDIKCICKICWYVWQGSNYEKREFDEMIGKFNHHDTQLVQLPCSILVTSNGTIYLRLASFYWSSEQRFCLKKANFIFALEWPVSLSLSKKKKTSPSYRSSEHCCVSSDDCRRALCSIIDQVSLPRSTRELTSSFSNLHSSLTCHCKTDTILPGM